MVPIHQRVVEPKRVLQHERHQHTHRSRPGPLGGAIVGEFGIKVMKPSWCGSHHHVLHASVARAGAITSGVGFGLNGPRAVYTLRRNSFVFHRIRTAQCAVETNMNIPNLASCHPHSPRTVFDS